jgi:hypothetical protein
LSTLLARGSVTVDCSAALAWATVSNMERFGDWFPAVQAVASANALPHGMVGKAYLETVAVPLRGLRQVEITVKEALPAQRFVTEGRLPPLLPRMEIALDAQGPTRTRIDWAMYSRSRSALVRWLLLPLASRTLQRRADSGLARLKTQLESARSSP